MKKLDKKINGENEKGSITIFVLIACLFFMFILSGIYISNLNKLQMQEENIKQIKENYERELNNIGEIYEETSKTLRAILTQEPKNNVWTKENVRLTGTAKIDRENNNATIVGYNFVEDSEEEPTEWITINNEIEIVKTKEVDKNGTYYFWVKDSEDEKKVAEQRVTNIDKNVPIAGELGGKEYQEGEELGEYKFGTVTDKDVYVYIKDQGSDEESEVETKYEVKRLGTTEPIQTYTDPTLLTETGTYEITLKTEDKAGNRVEKKYTVIIDRRIAKLTLKHNDINGENYESGTWTKDNLYGEIDIDESTIDRNVEKYQYSYNGVIWNDISGEPVNTIDYTSKFPMGENKPEWISQLKTEEATQEENYYFEEQTDGTLKPNNTGKDEKTANSYFEIDLTQEPDKEVEITINATISSEEGADIGYATITESETSPSYDMSTGRFIYASGKSTSDYKVRINGGKKYYLHIGYRKDSSTAANEDTFIINSMKLKLQKIKEGAEEYTATFPMGESKPEWISNPINGDETNHFEEQADGTLKSNNAGKDDTTANSYFEIDLTNYENKNLEIVLNATISCEEDYDMAYATITESAEVPADSDEEGRFIYESGLKTSEYTTTVQGGKKYYLHIGYCKDSSGEDNDDAFIINNMKLRLKELETISEYSTTFPMSSSKPSWLKELMRGNNSHLNIVTEKYKFEIQADGTLKSNNTGINSSVAQGKFEIDLTDYPESAVEVILNATISSESNFDVGYALLNENQHAPSFDESAGRFIYISGTETGDYSTTIKGGKKYYLHIGYKKDSASSIGLDTFIINNIRLKAEKMGNKIAFEEYSKSGNKVTFKLKDDMDKEIIIRAVYAENKVSKSGNRTLIKIDKTAPVIENINIGLSSQTTSKIDLKIKEEGSGLRGYYISTEETAPTETSEWIAQTLNEFSIEGLNISTKYYIWVIDNVGHVSEKREITTTKANYMIDDTYYTETLEQAIEQSKEGSTIKLLNDYEDTSTAIFDKTNITLDVQGYTLTRSKEIITYINRVVGITGTGKITNGANNIRTIVNHGILTTKGSVTIENVSELVANAPIYTSNNASVTNIAEESKLKGYYKGIYSEYGTINVNGGSVEATYNNNAGYGIYGVESTINVKAGEVKGYNGISNTNGKIEMTGGKVIGTGSYGLEAKNKINVYGGRIEGKTYGIRSTTNDNITLGREDDELSTINPAVYGGSYGIYEDWDKSFNFYNGVIISNTKETAYRGIVNPRREHMPYTYADYEIEQKYCTILVPIVDNIEMEAIPTEYTNKNVTVKITYPYRQGITRQYSEDNITWKDTNDYIQNVIVEENKIIYARTVNESGVVTEENQIEITNIDKEIPVVTVAPEKTQYDVIEETDTIDLTITIKATDTGVSGLDIMQYAWAKGNEEPQYTDFDVETTLNKTKLKIGQYYLYLKVTDRAGNVADLEKMRYNIKLGDPVCRIGETKYLTIQDAVEACSKTAEDTQTTITMIKSTDEEFTTYEGQNIILDLNGLTVGNSVDKPICTNNGKLNIIDGSTEKTGKLESINGTAIYNKTTGTIILGDDGKEIEFDVPTIYGRKIGIQNEGIFEFYDGKIQGKTPIKGDVTKTPEQFGPVSTNYENGITTVQLGIVSGYEARIEWVYYTKVQDAVGATKTYKNGYRDTVTIIKDIILPKELEIFEDKDIILNLNGYAMSVAPNQTMAIVNKGNLEIDDSSIEKTGTINMNADTIGQGRKVKSAISNYNGELILKEGTINNNIIMNEDTMFQHRSCSAISNFGTGNVKIEGGVINSIINVEYDNQFNYCYGIYNGGDGTVNITGGIIKSVGAPAKNSRINNIGIYNVGRGEIKIEGGTIEVNKESQGYADVRGIENENGYVKITGGTIETKNNAMYSTIRNISGTIVIEGGTIKGNRNDGNGYIDDKYEVITNKKGEILIKGGTIINNSGEQGYEYNFFRTIYNDSGNITMEGGEIIAVTNRYDAYGIFNDSGNVTITGGILDSLSKKVSYAIYNSSGGNITITDGTINSKNVEYSEDYDSYGIYNNGNVTIENGIINVWNECRGLNGKINVAYGIYNTNNASVVIGKKDDEFSLENIPSISGMSEMIEINIGCGIYNVYGNVEFYNGKIQGKTKAIIGNITKIRDTYKIVDEKQDNKDVAYLNKIENENVVEIDGEKFQTLGAAINYINGDEEKTVRVIKDFIISEPIEINKNVVLDLNGYYISNKCFKIENTKSLRIIDTTAEKEGKIENIGTIIGIINKDGATLSIDGGTIISNSENIDEISYGVYNKDKSIVQIRGGTVTSKINVYNANRKDAGKSYGIYNATNGDIIVEDGKIIANTSNNNSYGIYNNAGNIIIKGGEVIGNSEDNGNDNKCYGICNEDKGTITISGGIVKGRVTGVFNASDGNIVMTNGTISANKYGILNDSNGIITVEAGTILVNNNMKDEGDDIAGIYNKNIGNIIIGKKGDGIVSKENPNIKCETVVRSGYGIYNKKGKLYFYDGRIEGKTKAIYEIITEIEEETELEYNDESETIVTLSSEIKDVAQIGDRTYATLQEAIDSVENEKAEIKILRNVVYTQNNEVITNNKNVIIDLNGYKITSTIPEKIIHNEGTLEITDKSIDKQGIITTNEDMIIQNEEGAELIISNGTIDGKGKNIIYNKGNLDIKGGLIINNDDLMGNAIVNENLGNCTISGGRIITKKDAIIHNSSGKINMTDGMIETLGVNGYGRGYAIFNKNTGEIIISGGTVNSAIYNNSTGNITTRGGTISQIINVGESTIEIIKGTIQSGISNNNSETIIKIGEKGNELNIESPQILGEISTSGKVYFYDGKVKSISGEIAEIEDMTEMLVTDVIQLQKITTNVAEVNGIQYDSIRKAVKACGNEESTIRILRDSEPGATTIIEENQNITIDLNGYTTKVYSTIINKGRINITDSLEEHNDKLISIKSTLIKNIGTLNLEKVNISSSYGAGIYNNGTLTVNETVISNSVQGIYNNSKETLIINNSKIMSNTYGFYNIDIGGNVIINNGMIESNEYGIYASLDSYNYSDGKIDINNAEVLSNTYGIYNSSQTKITINGGKANSNEYGIYHDPVGVYERIYINNIEIKSNKYGIYNNDDTGYVELQTKGIADNTYGIYNNNGTTNVKQESKISSETGIYIVSGKVNLEEDVQINGNIGVHIIQGKMTIGTSGTMNSDKPLIIGEEYGIISENFTELAMYDGQIKGKTGAVQGNITHTENGYIVANKTEGEYSVAYLALAGTISTVAEVNGINYSNLQSAINSIVEGEQGTIKLTNGMTLTESLRISEGQDIILDMNGKTINSYLSNAITNRGTLTIIDTSGKNVAKISNNEGVVITNIGTLNLGQDDGTVNQELITIEGTTYGIDNSGTLAFYDGVITGTSAIKGLITSRPEGYMIRTTTVNGKERYYLGQ